MERGFQSYSFSYSAKRYRYSTAVFEAVLVSFNALRHRRTIPDRDIGADHHRADGRSSEYGDEYEYRPRGGLSTKGKGRLNEARDAELASLAGLFWIEPVRTTLCSQFRWKNRRSKVPMRERLLVQSE